MGTTTNISWTDHTFNPWIGCTKVSGGCTYCYAEELMDRRYHRVKWGAGQKRERTSEKNWKLPLHWDAVARKEGKYHRVFCASVSDWLDDEVDAHWLGDLLELIAATPYLTWQLLTKRPENFYARLAVVQGMSHDPDNFAAKLAKRWLDGKAPPNVWVGVSAEDQKNYDLRVPRLFMIPARTRFVSAEPLLGPILIPPGQPCVNWIIVGGESGPHYRPCSVDWILYLVHQCRALGIAPFVKQDSGPKAGMQGRIPDSLWVKEFPKP